MSYKNILILGNGFIARNLINHYKKENVNISLAYYNHKHECKDIKQYKVGEYSFQDIVKTAEPDYVIILQGNSFVPNNIGIADAINDNVNKIIPLLEVLKTSEKLEKILLVGSASEYGKMYDEPIDETFEPHPTSIYGLSKIILCNVFKFFYEQGLPIVYARQFNTTGYGQRDLFVLPSFCKKTVMIEKGHMDYSLTVGDLTQERDILDIRDTVAAYDILLKKGIPGEIYNVASGECSTIGSILDKVLNYSQVDQEKIKILTNEDLFSKEVSLSKRLHADISKLTDLGFKKSYSIDDTIKILLDYWRKHV